MADWYSVVGDTRRQFSTLRDGTGAPLDLTGMTCQLRIAEATTGRRHVATRNGVIVQSGSAPDFVDKGVVAYDPVAADVANPGDYLAQWVLTAAGKLRTVPDAEPFAWRIEPAV